MLPDHEIIRRLRSVRHSSQNERNARRAISINGLARQAGLTNAALYEILRTGRLGPRSRQGLTFAFQTYQVKFGVKLGGASAAQSGRHGVF